MKLSGLTPREENKDFEKIDFPFSRGFDLTLEHNEQSG